MKKKIYSKLKNYIEGFNKRLALFLQGANSTVCPKLDGQGLYGGLVQLICRGRLSRPIFQALLVSLNDLKRGQMLKLLDLRENIVRKAKISISILHPRIISTYNIPFSVTKFLIRLYTSLLYFYFFLSPILEESIFLIQLLGLHFSPHFRQLLIFTWMLVPSGPCWKVIECATSCRDIVPGSFCH